MNTETGTTQSYEGELDINNQLGDQHPLVQLTVDDQESRTRGQDHEDIETPQITPEIQHEGRPRVAQKPTTEIHKEQDIYALLQQLSQQMSQQLTQQTELLQKHFQEQSQQTKQLQEQQTKQIQQLSQQITQQHQVLRGEITTQLSKFKKENNEILQQFKVDTKTMIDEEISTDVYKRQDQENVTVRKVHSLKKKYIVSDLRP